MRKRTWQEYNQDLVKRGSLTFFIDQECLQPPAKSRAKRGRPRLFTHPLIQLLLVLKDPISDDLSNPGRVRKIHSSSVKTRHSVTYLLAYLQANSRDRGDLAEII